MIMNDYQSITIKATLNTIYRDELLRGKIRHVLKLPESQWFDYHIRRRSIDARKKTILAEVRIDVFTNQSLWLRHAPKTVQIAALRQH